DPVGRAVPVGILQNLDGIASWPAGRRGKGILHGLRDPEPAAIVEVQINRFADRRFGGDELNGVSRRQVEAFLFLGRSSGRGVGDKLSVGIVSPGGGDT